MLSIQSHTVHGYVGNKCAVLPLQLHGFDVDAINSVQFSNHTGYPSFKGSVMSGDDLWTIMEGLQANGLTNYTHLLTGYIGSVTLLQTIKRVVAELRKTNPNLIYVCDPVMGDEGRLYVGQDLAHAFARDVVPLASVLTPNQFEAELLTGMKICSVQDALAACRMLHDRGPQTVVITSLQEDGCTDITVVASTTQQQAQQQHGSTYAVKLSVPRISAYFTGTGDLFTALLLAWLHKCPGDLAAAVEKSVAALQAVLGATVADAGTAAFRGDRDAAVCAARELRLVQSQQCLVEAPVHIRACSISCAAPDA